MSEEEQGISIGSLVPFRKTTCGKTTVHSFPELAAIYYDKLPQILVVQCSELCIALIRDT